MSKHDKQDDDVTFNHGWVVCGGASSSDTGSLVQQQDLYHYELRSQMIDKAQAAYMLTIVVIAAFLLIRQAIKAGLTQNQDDNQNEIELKKLEPAENSDDEENQ